MALTEFEKNMDIIAALDDEPNDVGGLSAAELKAKFDEGGKALQDYINNTLLPALDNAGVERSVLLPLLDAGFKYMRLNSDKVLEVSTDSEAWQATGSSGHLIYNKNGEQLPQRSRLKFANGEVTDDGTYTIVQGEPGPAYTAGENISISGSVIATKAFPCNPNLLDNWYFGNPVNQRGASGTISTEGYFFDRWKLVSGSVTINSGGIVLNGTIAQVLEYAVGQTVTATVLTPDGVTDVTPVYDDETKTFTVTTQGKTIRAVKLELGTQQTLAHQENGVWGLNEIPDYGEQLRRCQRYCFVWGYGAKKTSCLAVMQCVQPGVLFGLIPTPVTMRNNPVMTGGRLTTFAGNVTSLGNLITCANGIRAVANIEGTSTSQGQAVGIENADDNGRVIFSADL